MATSEEKQELVKIIKFTPVNVTLSLNGYGGETYASIVDRKIYDFFKNNKYDIEEYANDSDGEWDDRVPEDLQPFPPGYPTECANLWHESGAELSESNYITVVEVESGDILWEHNLDQFALKNLEVTVNEISNNDIDDLTEDAIVFWGGQGEKGCFFEAEFTLREPFDPKKLSIGYDSCDSWDIITSVEYDGEDLEGFDGYSTSGKWAENKWIVSDDEVYDAVLIDDREEEEE